MLNKVSIFTVNRDKISGAGKVDHKFKLFLAGMAGHMNFGNFFIDNFSSATIKTIDYFADCLFVSGNKL